jgi:hypothetical protein
MTSVSLQPRPWPRPRWWGLVAAVFSLQLCLIFGLSDRTPIHPRPVITTPPLQFAGPGWAEALSLMDPALFALPHRQVFSGQAWMQVPQAPVRPYVWSEEPRWLMLESSQLGQSFSSFVQTNRFAPFAVSSFPEPSLRFPAGSPVAVSDGQSTVKIEGPLAQRRLLNPHALPSQPYSDLLTNTVVELFVDTDGQTVSARLLSPIPSVSSESDRLALETARAARFDAARDQGPADGKPPMQVLTWGRMIFQWHTVPIPATNAPTLEP